jgi:hypothetical protein
MGLLKPILIFERTVSPTDQKKQFIGFDKKLILLTQVSNSEISIPTVEKG